MIGQRPFRFCLMTVAVASALHPSRALDDGRYTHSPLKSWFERLTSRRGLLCCSVTDGYVLEDPDWKVLAGSKKSEPHYQVRINGPWIDVPDDAVIAEPNRVGKAMVWTVMGDFGMSIRCFMPGGMS